MKNTDERSRELGLQLFDVREERKTRMVMRDGFSVCETYRDADAARMKIRQLVAEGADINTQCRGSGDTPLMSAIEHRDIEFAGWILEENADPNVQDQLGDTVLMKVVNHGQVSHEEEEFFDSLLRTKVNLDLRNNAGLTVLGRAMVFRKEIFVKRLLDAGADPNVPDKDDGTPLMVAVDVGSLDGIRWLLEAGAEVNARDRDGGTALLLAAGVGLRLDIAQRLFREAGVDPKAIMDPARRKQVDGAALLAAGKVVAGRMPAERHRYMVEVFSLLLDAGAYVDAQDKDGYTALMAAAMKGHLEAVQILREKGANMNVRDKEGRTALVHATEGNHPKVVEYLRQAGAGE